MHNYKSTVPPLEHLGSKKRSNVLRGEAKGHHHRHTMFIILKLCVKINRYNRFPPVSTLKSHWPISNQLCGRGGS